MLIIGVDNGIDGGIAFLLNGKLVQAMTMPLLSKADPKRVDVLRVVDAITGKGRVDLVVIERPTHALSYRTAVSMADSFARIECAMSFTRVQFVSVVAKEWQKEFWPSKMTKKKTTKELAFAEADRLWPGFDWRRSTRSEKVHDGMVDAALIAEYGRIKYE
jgi:hypothetical protein